MFKKISVNVLTCQLGSVLVLKCWSHGKFVMLLLIAAVFALLKCQIFLSNGGGGILKFTLQYIIGGDSMYLRKHESHNLE